MWVWRLLEVWGVCGVVFLARRAECWGFGPLFHSGAGSGQHHLLADGSGGAECDGRVALVTGASRGLGKHIALALAEGGFHQNGVDAHNSHVSNIICVSRSLAGCQETADFINQKFPAPKSCVRPRAVAHSVDVANGADARVLVERLLKDYGKIDILVNNAGITRDKLILRMTPEDWRDVINTNLNSVFYFTRAVIRSMVRNKWGRIINMASVSGIAGQQGQANYSASKSAVIGFTKSLAKEVGNANVTVNAIAPGFIESEMTGKLRPAAREDAYKRIPAGRFGTANEVARVAAYLASEAASYVSGSVVVVDGGLMSGAVP